MKIHTRRIKLFLKKNSAKFCSALAALSLFCFFALNSQAASGTPSIISYQGRLADSSGNLLPTSGSSATYYFKFSIWDNATVGSGNRLWPVAVPATTTATVKQGVFNVNIGDVANGYPDLLNFNFNTASDIYLQVEVSSDNDSSQTLSPRQRIAASAFSRLASAVSGSTTPSSFGTTTPIGNSTVTIEATSTNAILLSMRAALNQVANLFQVQNSSGSNLFYSNATGSLFASSTFQVSGATTLYGNVGVATTTPGKIFSVQGNGLFSGDISTANLTATGTTRFNGITYSWPSSLTSGNFLQTDSGGNLIWAAASGGGGSDGNWTFITSDGGFIRLATTTNLVGVGTTTPYAKLSIGQTNGTGVATTTLALQPVSGQLANIIDIYNTSGALTSVFTAANFLGISTTSPATNLSVQGNALISGTLIVGNLTATNTTAGQPLIGNGSSAITSSSTLTVNVGGTGSTTLGGILAGNGTGAISSAIINSPLAFTLAGGITCTNCLNTASANGPLAITSSGSTYTFNASSSPFFGTLFATSTITLSGGRVDYRLSSTSTIPNNSINAFSVATSTTIVPTISISTLSSPSGLVGIGTTSPSYTLSVSGSEYLTGGLGVGQATTTAGAIEASGLILSRTAFANTGSATSTFSGGIQILGTGNVCLPDGTCIGATSGSGITSLNGLSGASQTFAVNGPIDIVSGGTTHTFNASSSPFFGTLFASSTIKFSNLSSGQLNSNAGLIYSGATTTFNSPLSYSAGAVSCTNCLNTATAVNNNTGYADLSTSNSGASYTFTLSATTSPTFGTITATSSISAATSTPLTLANLSSATNTAVRLSFRSLDAIGSAATTTSAITSLLTQNFNTAKGNLIFSTLRSGLLTEAGRFIDTGNLGVGTTSPAQNFSVQGNGLFSGNLTAANIIATGTLSVTGVSTLTGAVYASSTLQATGNALFYGTLGIATTSPAGNTNLAVQGNALFSGDLTLANLTATGTVNVGTTTRTAALNLDGSTSAVNGVATLYGNALLSHGSGAAFAQRFITTVNNSAVATSEGLLFRMIDNTSGFGANQLVRAIEVQADRGSGTEGVNTGLLAFGKTFGIQGVTTGSAAGNLIPAGVYAENQGTSTGNALKAYTSTSTTADLVSFYQEGSIFSGYGINLQLGQGSGSFTGNYLRFSSGTSVNLLMTNTGSTTLGNGVNQAGLAIPFGGLCVDNDGACNASTTGRISSVTSTLGNSDLAENYFSDETLEPGDMVRMKPSVDGQHSSVGRAQSAGDAALIGIVSTAPGVILGSRYEEDAANSTSSFKSYPIALSGRVPVKISQENGPVHQGDNLTSASQPGFAMKARPGDTVVGYALEDYDPSTGLEVSGDSLLVQTEIKQKTNPNIGKSASTSASSSTDNYKDHGGGVDYIDEAGVAKQKEKTSPNPLSASPAGGLINEGSQPTTESPPLQGGEGEVSGAPRILAFVNLSHHRLDITDYNYFASGPASPSQGGSTTPWSIDQKTGELKKGYFIDLKEADIVNARSILSSSGNWSIDENGKLTVQEIQTKKLCLEDICITKIELETLLKNAGLLNGAPAPATPPPAEPPPEPQPLNTSPEEPSP